MGRVSRVLSLLLIVLTISLIPIYLVFAQPHGNDYDWWNTSWRFRVGFNVTSTNVNRTNWPTEIRLNFTDIILQNTGQIEVFDNDSIRLVEYNFTTYDILYNHSFQFDKDLTYDENNNAVGTFVFTLNGTTYQNETRAFFIYFDTNDRPKNAPGFQEEISYSANGDEFYVNNSLYWAYVDTERADTTSGIYRINMSDGGPLLWVSAASHPAEYIKYNDSDQAFTYNLSNNYTVIYSGPSRYVIEQRGDEINWTTTNPSNQANLIKRYYFYPGIQWIKIEHTLIAETDINRQSFFSFGPPPLYFPGPLTIEQGRLFGYYTSDGTGAEPYSWYASNSTTDSRGLGVININETGTTNFRASLDSTPGVNYRIGIGLSPTTITNGNSISQTAVMYFDNTTLAVETKTLRNVFSNQLEISFSNAERWNVTVNASADFYYYNRNETITLTTNVTDDYYNLTKFINATLNATSDIVELYDDGTNGDPVAADGSYTTTYNISDAAPTGLWNSTSRAYDWEYQFLNLSEVEFYITDLYFMNINILNPDGITNRSIIVNTSVFNFRNDTGINYATIPCEWNTTVFYANITFNDTLGNYTLNFTGPGYAGNFTLTCNATRNNNLGTIAANFSVEEPRTFVETDMKPDSHNYAQVYSNLSEWFIFNVTLFNNDNGTAYDFNITVDVPASWFVNGSQGTFTEGLGDILSNATLVRYYNVTVPNSTYSGNYTINSSTEWRNPDNSTNSTMDTSYAIVISHVVLERLPLEFVDSIIHSYEKNIGDILLNSTGNDPVYNVTFNVTNGNFSTFNTSLILVEFDPVNISTMDTGNQTSVGVNLTIPPGFAPDTYFANITINTTNNGNLTLFLNITVPLNRTWNISTSYCNVTATQPTGTVCVIDVNNTGNVPIDFTVNVNFTETPVGYNGYTQPNETSFTLNAREFYPLEFEFDASGAGEGSFVTNYTVNGTQANAIPDYINITVNLTTYLGPWITFYIQPTEIPQLNNVLINASVEDRSVVGVIFTQVNITIPNGTSYWQNISMDYWYMAGSGFNTTVWTIEFPLNGSFLWGSDDLRGNYTVFVESFDDNTIKDTKNDTFVVYINMTIDSRALDTLYEQGETGNILYNSTFINNSAIPSVTSTISIIRPDNYLLQSPATFTSNQFGTIDPQPQFEIMSDAPLGLYNVTTNSTYYDEINAMWVNHTINSSFTVQPYVSLSEFSADIESTVVWYPTSTMTFLVTTYLNSVPVDPDSMNLTIYQGSPQLNVVYTGYDMSNMTRILRSGYPYYQAVDMGTPSSGDYWALLSASRGGAYTFTLAPFRVATGGPYDVYVSPDANEVAPGNNLPFTLDIWNMGEFGQDVDVTWWITDAANTTQFQFHSFPAYTPGLTNTTILKNFTTAYISSDRDEGEYYINVLVNYSLVEAPKFASAPFTVTAAAAPWCGDNICNGNETIVTCSNDCYCGNGACDPGESDVTCFADCGFIGPDVPIGGGITTTTPIGIPNISITAYPTDINIERGYYNEDWNHVTVSVRNTGSVTLHNVTLNITGFSSDWLTLSPKIIENLTAAESIIFDLWVNVPGSSSAQTYEVSIRAESDEAADNVTSTLRVFESTRALYQYEIDKLYEDLADMEARATSLQAQNYDVSSITELLNQARSRLGMAQNYLDNDQLDEAKYPIVGARNLLEEAERIFATLQRPTVITELLLPWWVYLLLLLFIVVVIVLIYMVFRGRRSKRLVEEMYAAGGEEYSERITREVKKRKPEDERIERLEAALKTLKRQHDEGLLSDEVYNELKEKQEEQLKRLK